MSTAQLSSGSPALGIQRADLEVIVQQESKWQFLPATCDPSLVQPESAMLAPDLGCQLLVTWAPASAAVQAKDLQALFQQVGRQQAYQSCDQHNQIRQAAREEAGWKLGRFDKRVGLECML